MQKYVIDDQAVVIDGEENPSEELARAYLAEANRLVAAEGKDPSTISSVKVFVEDGVEDVRIEVEYVGSQKFERIRRITG